jgi:phytoene desaturase
MASIIVIGAGIGGLAAAARLARHGYQVTVVERHATPGGRTGRIEKDGFLFDTGPTLFLMPEVFAETYQALGERMEDHLELVRLDPTYRAHFHDGSSLDLSANLVEMRDRLESLEPGSFEAFLRFMAEGRRHYRVSLEHFVGRNFNSIWEYFRPANIPLLFQLKALVKHHPYTSRFFKDSRLQAAFSFQNMYLGLSPYEAPATFSLLQYTELADGVWFPRGGMFKVIESLESIARALGVRFHYGSAVRQIEIEGGRAIGVRLDDGGRMQADFILANADLPYVYSDLLPDDGTAARLAKKKYTSSALMFFWGLRGPQAKALLHHNVFLADNQYQASFDRIFHDLTLPDDPSFYINAPARTDPSFAPPDGDTLVALVPVGHLNEARPQEWEKLEERARRAVFQRLARIGLTDLEDRIVFEAKWGPPYYRKALNLAKGSAFGLSHNFAQVGYLRPHNRHPRYRNLYFAGASTHPGTGLPIVLLSARLAVERLLNEHAPEERRSVSFASQAVEVPR